MKEHGADILRLWTMTSNYSDDIRIGKDMLKNTSNICTAASVTLCASFWARWTVLQAQSVFPSASSRICQNWNNICYRAWRIFPKA